LLKFSLKTSAPATSLRTSSWPLGCFTSTAKLFLLRLNMGKKPAPEPIRRRVLSPFKGSILMTSAPRSARIIPQVGPITIWMNSRIRMPSNGKVLVNADRVESDICRALNVTPGHAGLGSLAVERFTRQALQQRPARREEPLLDEP